MNLSTQAMGLLIGGILPAVFFAICNLFVKSSNDAGIGTGIYIFLIGLAVAIVGLFWMIGGDRTINLRSGSHAMLMGMFWSLGVGFVAIGITRYGAPLGKVVPLYNLNTLITVLLALWIFSEWKEVRVPHLLFGSLLIVVGGVLVARA